VLNWTILSAGLHILFKWGPSPPDAHLLGIRFQKAGNLSVHAFSPPVSPSARRRLPCSARPTQTEINCRDHLSRVISSLKSSSPKRPWQQQQSKGRGDFLVCCLLDGRRSAARTPRKRRSSLSRRRAAHRCAPDIVKIMRAEPIALSRWRRRRQCCCCAGDYADERSGPSHFTPAARQIKWASECVYPTFTSN
jgi:hypothetical protein